MPTHAPAQNLHMPQHGAHMCLPTPSMEPANTCPRLARRPNTAHPVLAKLVQ